MATLPTGFVVTTTGNYSFSNDSIGGAAVGITSATTVTAGSPLTRTLTVADMVASGIDKNRSVPQEISGVNHTYSAEKAVKAGTFAYTAPSTGWIIRTWTGTVNGSANTSILLNGNEQHRSRTFVSNKQKGAKLVSAHVAGYWNPVGVVRQRTNWTTAPSTANVAYVLPTNNGSDADDQAIFVTYKSVPGELTYHYGSGAKPTTDEYKVQNL